MYRMASFKNESNRNQTTLIVVGTATVTIVATTAVYCWWKMQIQRKRNRQIIGNKGADVENNNMDPLLSVTTKTANTKIIYLDYNGTTPVYPEIVQAMVPFFQTHFGNPGSRHVLGDVPRQAIQRARQQILVDLLGAATATLESSSVSKDSMDSMYSSILFTACGTESDNLMIHLALQQQYSKKSSAANIPHIVTSNVEHPAIDACLRHYESIGRCTVTFVPVQTDGRVSVKDMIAAIRPNTILVTLMVANNESGALQPVAPVAQYCRRHNILFATDAAQAVGKVPVTISDLGDPDMIAIVGHKIGAPKGIACLYIRPGCLQTLTLDGVYPKGLLLGGGQEFGLRGGTENVPYIVGLGLAAANAAKNLARNRQTMETMRHRLRIRLVDALGDENVFVHGPEDPNYRLPNTLSVGFGGGINSASLLSALRERVAASAGATCHASGSGVSTVLTAMGIPEHIARSTIRLSLGPYTTADEIDRAASILAEEIWRQRSLGEFEKTEFSVRATRTLEGDSERFDLPL